MRRSCACILICAMAAAAGRCAPRVPSIPEAVATDLIITAAIKTALLNDREVKGVRIDVETVRGVVTLSGVVPTEAGERRAIELARAVNGVVAVKSRLQIDRCSLPLAVHVACASPHEVRLVDATLGDRFIAPYPPRLIGDRAYDSGRLDAALWTSFG